MRAGAKISTLPSGNVVSNGSEESQRLSQFASLSSAFILLGTLCRALGLDSIRIRRRCGSLHNNRHLLVSDSFLLLAARVGLNVIQLILLLRQLPLLLAPHAKQDPASVYLCGGKD